MSFRIAIIGTGNVAWHLGLAMENAGHVVSAVAGKNLANVEELSSNFYQAEPVVGTDLSKIDADLVLICVSDDAIETVAQHLLIPKDCVLAHTSGTKTLSALGYAQTENIGVFYPLQTFTKGKNVDMQVVPFCLEADNANALQKLETLAKSISNKTAVLNSSERAVLHLAAVFASNFTNHMLTLAQGIMKHNEMEYDLLKPLITETINKSLNTSPEFAQTGPAKRGDLEILDKQFKALSNDPETAALYKTISQHILDYYSD